MNDKAYKFSTRDSTEFTVGDEGVKLPEVTADDNGDVLTVVEGAWAKATPVSGLPEVTGDDNGDVLTVVEGTWAKAAPSGGSGAGSGVMVVDIEFGPPEEVGGSPIQSLNKTWQEICDAMTAGTPVLARLVAPEGSGAIGTLMYLIEQAVYSDSENAYVVSFSDQVYYTSTADGYPVYGRK